MLGEVKYETLQKANCLSSYTLNDVSELAMKDMLMDSAIVGLL